MTTNPTFGLPADRKAVDSGGSWISYWYQWAVRISQLTAESPFDAQTVGASPWTFTASTIGNLCIEGGTVSSVVLARSGTSITVSPVRFVPMAANDTVTVTYSVVPTVTFVPSARA